MYQSAYRRGHSTETFILFCTERIYDMVGSGKRVLFLSLDLTEAFDTVHFTVLLRILTAKFFISGTVLKFFESYLLLKLMCFYTLVKKMVATTFFKMINNFPRAFL